MTETGASADAAALLQALEETARLLEAGDGPGAAQAMASVTGRCRALASGGLDAPSLAAARQLLDRVRHAEALLRRKVTDEMGQMGTSRRALDVYQR